MNRAPLALAAVAALALAAALAPAPAPEGRGLLGALGASMGGVRVMVIDALFLRAESQKKAGRIDDAAALYESVLELDPANEFATVYLVNTIVDEILPQAAHAEERFRWWGEARRLLLGALARRPRSAMLHARMATLILDARHVDPDLGARVAEALGLPRRVAVHHLRVAMREAATLPRGRGHLLRLALVTPAVAVGALADGAEEVYAEMVETARETLAVRGDVLARMYVDDPSSPDLRQVLEAGMEAAAALAAARAGAGSAEAAEARIEAYERLLPGTVLANRMRALLAK